MEGGIFLTVKDMQRLLGTDNRGTASRAHLALRDALKKTKYVSIKEYCDYEKLDFTYVWEFLRGKKGS